MTDDEAVALGQEIVGFSNAEQTTAFITHTKRAVTRIEDGRILSDNTGEGIEIAVMVRVGKRPGIRIVTDQRDRTSLRRAVETAEALARQQQGAPEDREYIPVGPRTPVPVSLWSEHTALALDGVWSEVIPRIVDEVRSAKFIAAGFIGGIARTQAIVRKSGLSVVARETDVECTVTARAVDGTSSGWAGNAARDWVQIEPLGIARRAIELATQARSPVAVEPGRRTVILSPVAVAQLVRSMSYAYDAQSTVMGGTPFSDRNASAFTKMGQQVFDRRLQIVSNPADPLGGYAPFYRDPEAGGIPVGRVTWIDHGILALLSFSIGSAVAKGRPYHMIPESIRVEPVAGTSTVTLDDMIANCREGIFVNRLSNVELLDRRTGLVTGTTRDGCFLVKDGKIAKSVKNFRFLESPFFLFNRLEAIGQPERAPLGYVRPPELVAINLMADQWPLPPVIVPPLMIRDFNFSSLVDAI